MTENPERPQGKQGQVSRGSAQPRRAGGEGVRVGDPEREEGQEESCHGWSIEEGAREAGESYRNPKTPEKGKDHGSSPIQRMVWE